MKLSKAGIPSFNPFLFLMSLTSCAVLEVGSNGSPWTICQCEKTH